MQDLTLMVPPSGVADGSGAWVPGIASGDGVAEPPRPVTHSANHIFGRQE